MSKKAIDLIVLLLVITLALTISACSMTKPKTVLTAEEFKTKMESAGMTVEDATGQFDEETLELLLIAYNDDYQIEFYMMDTNANAEQAFAGNMQNFDSLSGTKSTTTLNGSNFNYFSMTMGDRYAVVSRVENTFIYIDEETENKDAIKAIMDELGY